MSAVEAVKAARAAGIELRVDGETLVLEAAAPATRVIDMLSGHKPALVALLCPGRDGWTAQDWQAYFDERAAIAEFDGGYPRQEAEARGFGACVVEWLIRNAVGVAPTARAWLHSGCWTPCYEHRQAQAVDFFQTCGIAAPSEFLNDFEKNRDA